MIYDYTALSAIPVTQTETWENRDNWYIVDGRNDSNVSLMSDAEMGNFCRIAPLGGAPVYGIPFRSRAHWNKNHPINVKARVRATTLSGSILPWCGLNLYSSEAEYWGVTWSVLGAFLNYYYNALWVDTDPDQENPVQSGAVVDFEVDYDPTRNPTTLFKCDEVVIGSVNFIPTAHPSVWIAGTYGEAGPSTGNVDLGAIVVTGVPVFSSTDAGNSGSWTKVNASHELGVEYIPGSHGQMHFHSLAGGLTVRNSTSSPFKLAMFESISYPAGSFSAQSPTVERESKFGMLKLIGSVRSGGSLKVFLRDSATNQLISESELPGNSAGFTPVYGSVLSVDLTEIQSSSIYADIQGVSPSATTTPITSSNQPNVGPPILKAISIEEAPPQVGSDPVTVTPSISEAQLTGTLSADSVSAAPNASAAELVGTLSADSVTITPTVSESFLVGALTADSATITPAVSAAELTGILTADDVAVTPVVTMAELQAAALTGSGSIRSPSGATVAQYLADGTPVTNYRYIQGMWQ
jgi:hypothetical protein